MKGKEVSGPSCVAAPLVKGKKMFEVRKDEPMLSVIKRWLKADPVRVLDTAMDFDRYDGTIEFEWCRIQPVIDWLDEVATGVANGRYRDRLEMLYLLEEVQESHGYEYRLENGEFTSYDLLLSDARLHIDEVAEAVRDCLLDTWDGRPRHVGFGDGLYRLLRRTDEWQSWWGHELPTITDEMAATDTSEDCKALLEALGFDDPVPLESGRSNVGRTYITFEAEGLTWAMSYEWDGSKLDGVRYSVEL